MIELPQTTARPTLALPSRRAERARQWLALRWLLLLADALVLALAVSTAHWIRFKVALPIFQTQAVGVPHFYLRVGTAVVLLWLILFFLAGLYRLENLLGGTSEYSLIFNASTVGLILVSFGTFLNPQFNLARAWLVLAWGLTFLYVALERFWVRRLVYALRGRGLFLAPALVVGTNGEATALADQLANSRFSGLNILGFVAADPPAGEPAARRHAALGSLADLDRLIERYDVEVIIAATSGIRRDDLIDLFRRFSGRPDLRLRLSGGLFEIVTTRLEVRQLSCVSLLEMVPVRLRGSDVLLKSILDYGIALTVVIAGAPLYLLLWLAVRLDSPGPVIHRRRVLGLGGKEFDAFKFRSMHQNGDAILARQPEMQALLASEHKLKQDPRVTRVGHWLRQTSLDELPQVFNVLRGEMSIVGPRMIAPGEHEKYGQWDMNLLTVRPGITGLWQVSGRSDLSYDERVRLDMSYIRNWTIWLDLQILLQTIPAVFGRRGAY